MPTGNYMPSIMAESPAILSFNMSYRYDILLKSLPTFRISSWIPSTASTAPGVREIISRKCLTQHSLSRLGALLHSGIKQHWLRGKAKHIIVQKHPAGIGRNLNMAVSSPNAAILDILLVMIANGVNDYNLGKGMVKWLEEVQPLPLLKLLFSRNDFAHQQVSAQLAKMVVTYATEAMLDVLIEAGLNWDLVSGYNGKKLLLSSIQSTQFGNASRLLTLGAEADEEVMRMAIDFLCPASLIILLLASGADPDTPYDDEDPPLRRAVIMLNEEAVLALIDGGADESCLDELGMQDFADFDPVFTRSSPFNSLHAKFPYRWDWLTAFGVLQAASNGVDSVNNYVEEAEEHCDNMYGLLEKAFYEFFVSDYGPLNEENEQACDIIMALLEYGVDPNLYTVEVEYSPVSWIVEHGDIENSAERLETLLEALLSHEVLISAYELLMLTSSKVTHFTVSMHDRLLQLLRSELSAGRIAGLSERLPNGCLPIQDASSLGDYGLVQHLIDLGTEINCPLSMDDKYSALHCALRGGHSTVAKLLIEYGARVNCWPVKPGETLFECFAYCTEEEILEILIKNGAELNDPMNPHVRDWGSCLAHLIWREIHPHIVHLVLRLGADVHCVGWGIWGYPRAPIQAAAKQHNSSLIIDLIAHGANINQPASETRFEQCLGGRTALQAACEVQSLDSETDNDCVRFLLDRGADVNAPPARDRGITALQGAAASGNIEAVLLLLEHGADVDAPGAAKQGRTALEAAAEHGRLDIVKILLNAYDARGLKPDCTSALKLAEKEVQLGVASLLRATMNSQMS